MSAHTGWDLVMTDSFTTPATGMALTAKSRTTIDGTATATTTVTTIANPNATKRPRKNNFSATVVARTRSSMPLTLALLLSKPRQRVPKGRQRIAVPPAVPD